MTLLEQLIRKKIIERGIKLTDYQTELFGSQPNFSKRLKNPENLRAFEILKISKSIGIGVGQIVKVANGIELTDQELSEADFEYSTKCKNCEQTEALLAEVRKNNKTLEELCKTKDLLIERLQKDLQ